MPFTYTTLFTDDFNRADNLDLGTAWDAGYTTKNPMQIVGNKVRVTATGSAGSGAESVNTPALGPNQWAQTTITDKAAGAVANVVSVMLRAATPPTAETFYVFQAWHLIETRIVREVNDVFAVLASVGVMVWEPGDVMKFVVNTRVDGAVDLWGYRNGAQLLSVMDTAPERLLTGRAGLMIHVDDGGALSDAQADNFEAGTVIVPAFGARVYQRQASFPDRRNW